MNTNSKMIETLKADTRTMVSVTAKTREREARKEVLERYGVTDMRDVDISKEVDIFHAENISLAGEPWATLHKIAPAIAYKKMRFKYLQGYDSFNPASNYTLHDDLTGDALTAMAEYIVNTHCKPVAVMRYDLKNVIRAGYAGMDKRIDTSARDERKHLFADVYDVNGVSELQDVTACIESNYIGSDIEWIFNIVKDTLTARQLQVFKYRLKGYTDETIAKRLKCSRVNVTKIRHAISERLQFLREYL